MLIIFNECRRNMKVEIYEVTKKIGIIGSYTSDAKSNVNKLNNGHVVQKDYFVICIARLWPSLMTI